MHCELCLWSGVILRYRFIWIREVALWPCDRYRSDNPIRAADRLLEKRALRCRFKDVMMDRVGHHTGTTDEKQPVFPRPFSIESLIGTADSEGDRRVGSRYRSVVEEETDPEPLCRWPPVSAAPGGHLSLPFLYGCSWLPLVPPAPHLLALAPPGPPSDDSRSDSRSPLTPHDLTISHNKNNSSGTLILLNIYRLNLIIAYFSRKLQNKKI